jgi:hypothetical protein
MKISGLVRAEWNVEGFDGKVMSNIAGFAGFSCFDEDDSEKSWEFSSKHVISRGSSVELITTSNVCFLHQSTQACGVSCSF